MRRYTLEQFFDIIDDNIDEDEQSFAIVAEIGLMASAVSRLHWERRIALEDVELLK